MDPRTRARLMGVFLAEAEETLALLDRLASRFSQGISDEDLSEFGRAAHGLKGAATSVGLTEVAGALHDLEALSLGLPRAGGSDAERLRLRRAIDLLAQGMARMGASGQDVFPPRVLQALRLALAGETTAAAGTRGGDGAPARAPAPDAPGAPPDASAAAGEVVERLSVPAEDVDAAVRLAASLARGVARLQERLGEGRDDPAADAVQSVLAQAQRLEASISGLRLLPAESALAGLEGEVEHLCLRLSKEAELVVQGGEVRADRRTLQAARGMVRHLVRNALDHGIEPPRERLRLGKAARGRLSVRVEAVDSALRVRVDDDGAGFDLAAIREAIGHRPGAAGKVASLSDEEVLTIFAAEGGSTRASADEISGRGLGLSAVAGMASAAGGSLRVTTRRGQGSAVTFTLPLEVYAADVLLIVAEGRTVGLPLAAVERTVLLGAGAAVHQGPSGASLAVDEHIVPLHALAEVLGAAPSRAMGRFAVLVRADDHLGAFAVDEIGSVTGTVPASVPGIAQAGSLVTGLAQLDDGSVVVILDPKRLLARARGLPPGPRAPAPAASEPGPLDVVLAEDSLATREVLRVLLEEQGCQVRLAADGEEALARLAERLPDVLVTDINMPRRDGLALTRQVRGDPRTARMPVVLLTSQEDAASQEAGAAAGADAYLVKSRFNADVLRETLARIGARKAR